jgi:hypothetical protein
MNEDLKISLDLDIVSYAVLGMMQGCEIKVNCTKNGERMLCQGKLQVDILAMRSKSEKTCRAAGKIENDGAPDGSDRLGRGAGAFRTSAATQSTLHLPGGQNLDRPRSSIECSVITAVRSAAVMRCFFLNKGSEVFSI